MGTSGDKIVLLDGMGSGSGSATNGLLSMIPGMFANLIGGNKMDPNLVAALMNGRNNQDGFGGANGWWLWIIVLFWLWGGRGFGNGFGGNGNDCCANGLPAQLNNDYGRELLMQAIQGNRSAIDQIANALNCTTTQLQNAICNVQGAIDKVAGQVGMTSQAVINAVQQQGCEIGNQISSCCCNLQSAMASGFNNIQHSLDTVGCNIQNAITRQGYENQLAITGQTNVLQNNLTNGFNNVIQSNQAQTQALAAKIDLQTQIINDKFCQLEMREMQNTIQQLREEKQALATSAITQQQTQNIVSQLAPKAPVPAYVVQNPGCCYTPTVRVANECGCACGTTNAVL